MGAFGETHRGGENLLTVPEREYHTISSSLNGQMGVCSESRSCPHRGRRYGQHLDISEISVHCVWDVGPFFEFSFSIWHVPTSIRSHHREARRVQGATQITWNPDGQVRWVMWRLIKLNTGANYENSRENGIGSTKLTTAQDGLETPKMVWSRCCTATLSMTLGEPKSEQSVALFETPWYTSRR